MMSLLIHEQVVREMIADSRSLEPREAVGLLAAPTPGSPVTRCFPLPNIATEDHLYWADPFAQWQAFRSIFQERLRPVAVYHSHPGGGTELSARDIAFARELGLLQVVIALGDRVERLAAHAVDPDGSARPVEISMVISTLNPTVTS
ncbi:MAG: Mov34/MPN/PAD-1 family protein [Acidobacteria bacterium]|nr:Mov34/MPN/PAD-1 family protein [Acidobacteriota bacterium]MBV9479023.1 Mov34/MPN/PAD-1 family protein [Acidobacteriota bacterium]